MANSDLTVPGSPNLARRFVVHQVASGYMAPTLNAGDLVEIDTLEESPNADAVYLIALPFGEPALRRLQVLPQNNVRVTCDAAPDDGEVVERSQIRVLGKAHRALCGRIL